MDLNILVQTLPEKPRSPNQKYKTKDEIVKIIKNMYEPLIDEKSRQKLNKKEAKAEQN
ncbi:MAG: hypothetical protein PHF18_06215 [Methanosarcina sp.]|uniref:hypothetical protein n=1 Tax=Methanosarcina sp. TaxID=2213 RepID=UPI002624A9B2|nr:hypothetical protein [Methanosarcina sp.]MDD3246432.1 hypothetical protein [Methanosarcina sp.]